MNPHQKNKIDLSSLTEEEQKMFRLYGRLPNRKDLIQNKLKQERKYFDSGDYALSKAGKAQDAGVVTIGSQHPSPESIPHHTTSPTPQAQGNNGPLGSLNLPPPGIGKPAGIGGLNGIKTGSPVKEGSFLQRQTSVDDVENVENETGAEGQDGAASEKQ